MSDKRICRHRTALFLVWPFQFCRCAAAWVFAGVAIILPILGVAADEDELRRQLERERELRDRLETRPDVRLDTPKPAAAAPLLPTGESPCFVINNIALGGSLAGRFAWALAAADPPQDPATGRCLGVAGINAVVHRVQNAIIAGGYITTRVLVQPQDISGGRLVLSVAPGRVREIRGVQGNLPGTLVAAAFPARPGELLNLRDLEQALENFRHAPSVDADIQIVPSAAGEPGDSDILVNWRQNRPVRLAVSLDDAGSEATGKYQGAVTLFWDNPLLLNDSFYVNVNRALGGGAAGERGTQGYTAHYSVPAGYWSWGVTAGGHDFHQQVQGINQTYTYSGTSRNGEVRLSRLLHRDRTGKTGVALAVWLRESSNYVDDAEIELQHRRMAGWILELNHRQYLNGSTLTVSLGYRRGADILGALPAPEEATGEGTSRAVLVTADAQLSHPFRAGKHFLYYTAQWRAQWNQTPLVPQDLFAIGGRYTVRGFDGETVLSGECGWLVRNELGIPIGGGGQQVYVGADYGTVGGPSTKLQPGTKLAGAVMGLRGGGKGWGYDVFIGVPLSKPAGFKTAANTAGFQLGYQL